MNDDIESVDGEIAKLRSLIPKAEGQPNLQKSLCDSIGKLIETRQRVMIRGSKVLSFPAVQRILHGYEACILEAIRLYAPEAEQQIVEYLLDGGRELLDSHLARNERDEIKAIEDRGKCDPAPKQFE